MPELLWLPEPPEDTPICLGFDGSENDDWTAIQAETIDGYSFTPSYGPDARPTVWNPAEWGGDIPRNEVHAAVEELFDAYRVERFYCDPQGWSSDIGDWALKHGEEHVFEWETNRPKQMHTELLRFHSDLKTKRIRHDGCPLATGAVRNAVKRAMPAQRYILGKPTNHQKIDVLMARILAHTAAEDAKVAGWTANPQAKGVSSAMYGFN